MRRCNDQCPRADQIPSLAVDSRLAGREVGDPSEVLQVLSVAKQHDTLDLVLHSSAQARNGIGHDCSTLRVATCSDGCVGAFRPGEVEETLGFADSGLRGTRWECVLGEASRVGTAYTLNPDIGCAICAFESVGCKGADQRTLQ